MNQVTDPDKITYKEARCQFAKAAPIMFAVNAIAGLIIWFLRDHLFKQEADYLGGLIAGGLIVCGIFIYVILKAMSKRIIREEKMNKQKK